MEKNQLNLILRVLKKMYASEVLDNLVIVGSWALYFYQYYFHQGEYFPDIRTRDIDFLVPLPPKFKRNVDIPLLLKEFGFIVHHGGTKGYIRLDHPELIVEFLIPEMGKGRDTPYPLPSLGLNAQPLRFLHFLAEHTITIEHENMKLRLPHPAAYALHKLIIFDRRRTKDKAEKDSKQAIQLLQYLEKNSKDIREIKTIFSTMHKKWQKTVLENLKKLDEENLIQLLVKIS